MGAGRRGEPLWLRDHMARRSRTPPIEIHAACPPVREDQIKCAVGNEDFKLGSQTRLRILIRRDSAAGRVGVPRNRGRWKRAASTKRLCAGTFGL